MSHGPSEARVVAPMSKTSPKVLTAMSWTVFDGSVASTQTRSPDRNISSSVPTAKCGSTISPVPIWRASLPSPEAVQSVSWSINQNTLSPVRE